MQLPNYRFIPKGLKINSVITTLAISDSFLWFGNFLFTYIVAIHLEERILTDPITAIATSYSIYLVTRAIFQIPVSHYLDTHASYKDEVYAIFLGSILMALSFIGYEIVDSASDLYILNMVFGVGVATYLPAWKKTFSSHVDNGHEGLDFAFADVLLTLAGAAATAIGGYIVQLTGSFTYVFFAAAFIAIIGGFTALSALKKVK